MKLGFKSVLFFTVLVSGVFLIWLRLIDVQLLRGKEYDQLAENNRFYTLPIKAQRGIIFDRYGKPLVKNIAHYSLVADQNSLFSNTSIINREEALFRIATGSGLVVKEAAREYLYPALSPVLGYVGEVTAEELKTRIDLKPHTKLGKLGIEKFFDQTLHGVDGKEVFEINATSKKQRRVEEVPARAGTDLISTLDPELSQVAWEALGAQKGAVIISNATNGEILTMVTKPSFDANLFVADETDPARESDRKQALSELFADSNQPFFNRAIAGAYPPGSVFKLVTAFAGLENQQIDASTQILDEGVLKIDNFEFKSWYYWNFGKTEGYMDLVKAIARSNDIYFYKVAEWVGADNLAQMAKQFGFGDYENIEIGPESRGLIPTPKWKEETIGEKWYLGNTYHMGIGQGDVLTSPLQINGMIQAIANEGVWCQPKLVGMTETNCHGLGLKPENLQLVLSGMLEVCSPGGTAFPFFERNDELVADIGNPEAAIDAGAIACKTGTAEFGAADERGYRPTHGWFVGYLKPRHHTENFPTKIAITVLVESDDLDKSKEGSYDATPVAKTIVDYIESR
ncbi:hypothetical protein KJZ63_03190 [Patescibacteria group bacterium]|nr:hypothetical protein [Patescibacteria group bacterium]